MSTPDGSWWARPMRSPSACSRWSRPASTTSRSTCPASPTIPPPSSASPERWSPTSSDELPLGGFLRPLGRRCNLGLRLVAGAVEPGRGYCQEYPHLHVVVADSLARETHLTEQVAAL